MSGKAKVAVIGTGWWATMAHIPALLENPRAEPILVDPNPAALKMAADKYNLTEKYTSLSEAVAQHPDIKGAIVAVPHRFHYEVGKDVLEHGLHLLIEKPMVLTAKDAKSLIDLANSKNLEIQVGYTYPFLDVLQTARKRVEDGLLGEIEYVTCSMSSMAIEFYRGNGEAYRQTMNFAAQAPGTKTYSDPAIAGGGQGHLQVTHSASMMFFLAPGLRAHTVSAFMNNLDTKVDVADAFAVRMENGAVATIGSTGNLGKGDGGLVEIHLHGSKGRLLVDSISGLMYMRLHNGKEERIEPNYPPYPGNVPAQRFVETLLDSKPVMMSGKDNGLYTVELLDAAYRSAAQDGMPVKVASLYN